MDHFTLLLTTSNVFFCLLVAIWHKLFISVSQVKYCNSMTSSHCRDIHVHVFLSTFLGAENTKCNKIPEFKWMRGPFKYTATTCTRGRPMNAFMYICTYEQFKCSCCTSQYQEFTGSTLHIWQHSVTTNVSQLETYLGL